MTTDHERRSVPRVPLASIGTIDLGDRRVPCQTLDLSSKGLSVVTPEDELPTGPVRIRFQLGRRDAGWTEVDAKLVRARAWDETGVGSVWALELLPMDPGTRTHVRDFVQLSS